MKKINFKEIDYKKLAIQHCEKAVLVVFVCAMLWFVKSAATADMFKVTPEEVRDGAVAVQAHYDTSNWEKYEEELAKTPEKIRPELPNPSYPNRAEEILQPPNLAAYRLTPIAYPVIKPSIKRLKPSMLPLEELQVAAGYGPFAIVDTSEKDVREIRNEAPVPDKRGKGAPKTVAPPGGSEPYPVARTAQGKGAARILNNLKQGKGVPRRPGGRPMPTEDGGMGPQMGPGFGRAGNLAGLLGVTVGQGAKVEGRRWVAITGAVPYAKQQEEFWSAFQATPTNVRPEDYLEYVGFRVKRVEVTGDSVEAKMSDDDWKKIPELPLDKLQIEIDSWDETPIEPVEPNVIEAALCVPLPPIVGKTWNPEDVVHPKIPIIKEDELEKIAEEALKTDNEDAGKASAAPKGIFAVRNARRSNEDLARLGVSRLGPGVSIVKEQEYHLFRFFDFGVQPGKTYQYRVQLIARNPNFGLTEKELEKSEDAKEEYLSCPWSGTSAPVSLPLDSNLLVGPVKGRSPSKEAEATVMVRQWNSRDGVNAVKTFKTLLRGQLSNFSREDVNVINPKDESAMKLTMDFTTDLMLVDFTGGEKLHLRGTKVEPGEMLFVKPDGSLVVKSELQDYKDFSEESSRERDIANPVDPSGPGVENFIPGPGGDLDPLGGGLPGKGRVRRPPQSE